MSNKNIVLIIMDTARKKNVSAYGYERNTTPFLSELSSGSVVFDNAVSQAPWTLPSHASMFTGKYPSEHGAVQENPYLDSDSTVAQKLSDAGYTTGVFSANAWISPHTGLTSGFDVQKNFIGNLPRPIRERTAEAWKTVNENDRLLPVAKKTASFISWFHKKITGKNYESYTPEVMENAKQFMNGNDGDKFLCMNLLDPHLPYYPPLEYLQEFGDYDEIPDVCQDSKDYNAGVTDIEEDEWSKIRDLYDAEIRYVDDQIRGFVNFLKSKDEFQDTLLIVCSDHGELHGKHGIYGHEFGLYEELINVPLIINHPEMEANERSDTVELMDLYHTMINFASTSEQELVPERAIFKDDYRLERSENLNHPEFAFSEYSKPMIALHQLQSKAKKNGRNIPSDSIYSSRMHSIRGEEGKYISRSNIEDEFYSFENDKEEKYNLLLRGSNSSIIDYKDILDNHPIVGNTKRDEQLGVEAVDDTIKDRLGDLGYLE